MRFNGEGWSVSRSAVGEGMLSAYENMFIYAFVKGGAAPPIMSGMFAPYTVRRAGGAGFFSA